MFPEDKVNINWLWYYVTIPGGNKYWYITTRPTLVKPHPGNNELSEGRETTIIPLSTS
jgi:hypothetical protein